MPASVSDLIRERNAEFQGYSYAFLDDVAKREIRRRLLKAIAIPGYQVPFGSREMPIARGWGTGGLQITLSIAGPSDTIKVIDQGDDAGVNATNIRRLISDTTGVETTYRTAEASIIQTRHRITEEALRPDQIMVLQVPTPEPLIAVERSMARARLHHAEKDYAKMWLSLYEDIVRRGEISRGAGYPAMVHGRYIMATSPIPRWDVPKLHQAHNLFLFGAGREKRLYAVPPHTNVVPLAFEDHPFTVERFDGVVCARSGLSDVFFDEIVRDDGSRVYVCSDTAYADLIIEGRKPALTWKHSSPSGI